MIPPGQVLCSSLHSLAHRSSDQIWAAWHPDHAVFRFDYTCHAIVGEADVGLVAAKQWHHGEMLCPGPIDLEAEMRMCTDFFFFLRGHRGSTKRQDVDRTASSRYSRSGCVHIRLRQLLSDLGIDRDNYPQRTILIQILCHRAR